MNISATLLPEFDHEMAVTRKYLERLPEDKFGWQPHPKSGSLAWLAGHLANLSTWMGYTMTTDAVDIAPLPRPSLPETREAVLAAFDANRAKAREALAAASDETMMGSWSLVFEGKTLFTLPRVAVVRSFILSHLIHHRAQLGMYLRLLDVALPATYGPTADEPMM